MDIPIATLNTQKLIKLNIKHMYEEVSNENFSGAFKVCSDGH